MAKARGLMTGPSLSEVQVMGLHLLEVAHIRETSRASTDAIKNAMVSSNPRLLKVLYPEFSRGSKGGAPAGPPPSEAPPSMSEVDEMDQWIQQASSSTGASMSGADLYGPEDGWE